jgi:polysaccharide biosynthesis transport protein
MEYAPKGIADFLSGIVRRPILLVAVASIISLGALALALYLPPVYRSTATILIEQQEIPQDLVRSTVTSYADQRIQIIGQRVMTSQNLMEIIKKYKLFEKRLAEEPREVVLNEMRKAIRMDRISADVTDPQTGAPKKATVAFTLSYTSGVAEEAQRVANELVSLYLQENLKTRTASAEEAAGFLSQEAGRLREQMQKLDERLSTFKQENAGKLPDQLGVHTATLERMQSEDLAINLRYRSLEEREVALRNQMSQLEAIYSERSTLDEELLLDSRGQRIQPPKERLKGLELELLSLKTRYAATHPDVVRLEKEVAVLKVEVAREVEGSSPELVAKRAELASLKERYSDSHPDVRRLRADITLLEQQAAADPEEEAGDLMQKIPAMVEIRTQLGVIELEKKSLVEERGRIKARLAELEDRIAQAPQLEREMVNMLRERDALAQALGDLARRESQARLGESLEAERKGEKLTLIEPPTLPERPASPNRKAIAIMGLALGILLSIGATVGLEALDHRIRGGKTVAALLAVPPLGLIPPIVTLEDRRRRRNRRIVAAVGAMASVTAGLVAIHVFFRPLDMLWYQVLFRMGV